MLAALSPQETARRLEWIRRDCNRAGETKTAKNGEEKEKNARAPVKHCRIAA